MTFAGLIDTIVFTVIDPLLFLISTLALLYFVWGVTKYIYHSGDAEKRTEGYQMMIYGIIALFVMVSVWALVGVLSNTFLGGSSYSSSYRGGGSVDCSNWFYRTSNYCN